MANNILGLNRRFGTVALAAALTFGTVLTCGTRQAVGAERVARLTAPMREAIKRGLAFLAREQQPDGSFAFGGGGQTGIVAACATAFMSNGQLPGSGRYGTNVTRALNYIIRSQHHSGLLYYDNQGFAPMYNQGLSVLALAEAYGQYPDRRLNFILRKAVNLICSAQNAEGGWRYQPYVTRQADTSVTVMQLMALRAARDVGIPVPERVIRNGIAFVKSCHNTIGSGGDGGFSYMPNGASTYGCTGAGVTSLEIVGHERDRAVMEGIHHLLQFQPLGTEAAGNGFYFYDMYYATMGIYQGAKIGHTGRQAWRRWYPAVVHSLLATQQADGHWNSHGAPLMYANGVALLLLDIPMRVLPVYQR